MRIRKTLSFRIVALVTLVAFIFTMGLGDVFIEVAAAEVSPKNINIPVKDTYIGENYYDSINPDNLDFPENLGKIKYTYSAINSDNNATPKRTIFHIQDAHCNYQAQKKISEIIDYINSKYNIDTINLEGGSKKYDLSMFTEIEDLPIREKVTDYFVKEGIVSGAEYLASVHPEKYEIWGAEDVELYKENLKAYTDNLENKNEIDRYIANLSLNLNKLKLQIYNKELLDYDLNYCSYKSGEKEFKDQIVYLAGIADANLISLKSFSNVFLLYEAIQQEKDIDFKEAEVERNILIDEFKKIFSTNEVKVLIENSVLYKTGRTSRQKFYEYLYKKAETINFDFSRLPDLKKFMLYVFTYEAADKTAAIKEMSDLEEKIVDQLSETAEQKELVKLSKNLVLLKNLFNISLTREDYQFYAKNKEAFQIKNYIDFIEQEKQVYEINTNLEDGMDVLDTYRQEMETFFETSFKRDKAFVENLRFSTGSGVRGPGSGSNATILITGGFHSDNLEDICKQENISFISIMPNFTNPEGYICPYHELISNGEDKTLRAITALISSLAIWSFLCKTSIYGDNTDQKTALKVWTKLVEAEAKGEESVEIDGNNYSFQDSGKSYKKIENVYINGKSVYTLPRLTRENELDKILLGRSETEQNEELAPSGAMIFAWQKWFNERFNGLGETKWYKWIIAPVIEETVFRGIPLLAVWSTYSLSILSFAPAVITLGLLQLIFSITFIWLHDSSRSRKLSIWVSNLNASVFYLPFINPVFMLINPLLHSAVNIIDDIYLQYKGKAGIKINHKVFNTFLEKAVEIEKKSQSGEKTDDKTRNAVYKRLKAASLRETDEIIRLIEDSKEVPLLRVLYEVLKDTRDNRYVDILFERSLDTGITFPGGVTFDPQAGKALKSIYYKNNEGKRIIRDKVDSYLTGNPIDLGIAAILDDLSDGYFLEKVKMKVQNDEVKSRKAKNIIDQYLIGEGDVLGLENIISMIEQSMEAFGSEKTERAYESLIDDLEILNDTVYPEEIKMIIKGNAGIRDRLEKTLVKIFLFKDIPEEVRKYSLYGILTSVAIDVCRFCNTELIRSIVFQYLGSLICRDACLRDIESFGEKGFDSLAEIFLKEKVSDIDHSVIETLIRMDPVKSIDLIRDKLALETDLDAKSFMIRAISRYLLSDGEILSKVTARPDFLNQLYRTVMELFNSETIKYYDITLVSVLNVCVREEQIKKVKELFMNNDSDKLRQIIISGLRGNIGKQGVLFLLELLRDFPRYKNDILATLSTVALRGEISKYFTDDPEKLNFLLEKLKECSEDNEDAVLSLYEINTPESRNILFDRLDSFASNNEGLKFDIGKFEVLYNNYMRSGVVNKEGKFEKEKILSIFYDEIDKISEIFLVLSEKMPVLERTKEVTYVDMLDQIRGLLDGLSFQSQTMVRVALARYMYNYNNIAALKKELGVEADTVKVFSDGILGKMYDAMGYVKISIIDLFSGKVNKTGFNDYLNSREKIRKLTKKALGFVPGYCEISFFSDTINFLLDKRSYAYSRYLDENGSDPAIRENIRTFNYRRYTDSHGYFSRSYVGQYNGVNLSGMITYQRNENVLIKWVSKHSTRVRQHEYFHKFFNGYFDRKIGGRFRYNASLQNISDLVYSLNQTNSPEERESVKAKFNTKILNYLLENFHDEVMAFVFQGDWPRIDIEKNIYRSYSSIYHEYLSPYFESLNPEYSSFGNLIINDAFKEAKNILLTSKKLIDDIIEYKTEIMQYKNGISRNQATNDALKWTAVALANIPLRSGERTLLKDVRDRVKSERDRLMSSQGEVKKEPPDLLVMFQSLVSTVVGIIKNTVYGTEGLKYSEIEENIKKFVERSRGKNKSLDRLMQRLTGIAAKMDYGSSNFTKFLEYEKSKNELVEMLSKEPDAIGQLKSIIKSIGSDSETKKVAAIIANQITGQQSSEELLLRDFEIAKSLDELKNKIKILSKKNFDFKSAASFKNWIDNIIYKGDYLPDFEELKEIAKSLGMNEEDSRRIYNKAYLLVKNANKFRKSLPHSAEGPEGKINVFLYTDAYGLYSVFKLLGSEATGAYISKKVFWGYSGTKEETANQLIYYMINEAKKRLSQRHGIKIVRKVPAEYFEEFKEEFFLILEAILMDKESEINIESPLLIQNKDAIKMAATGVIGYLLTDKSIGLTKEKIIEKGVRFIDTSKTGSFVLFAEGLIKIYLKAESDLSDAEMEGKTDSRMYYSDLTDSRKFTFINTASLDSFEVMDQARSVETDYTPFEFAGIINMIPTIRNYEDEREKVKFAMEVLALKSMIYHSDALSENPTKNESAVIQETQKTDLIGKVVSPKGEVLTDFDVVENREENTFVLSHDKLQDDIIIEINTEITNGIDPDFFAGMNIKQVFEGLFGEDKTIPSDVKTKISALITGLTENAPELVAIKPHDNVKGFFLREENTLCLNEDLMMELVNLIEFIKENSGNKDLLRRMKREGHLSDLLGLIHELGEEFIEVPDGKEFEGLTGHTLSRGVGKDVRIGYQTSESINEDIGADELIEALEEELNVMAKNEAISQTRIQMRDNNDEEGLLTRSEMALIRYNASLGLKGKALLYGIQDHLDPAGNVRFSQEIKNLNSDLRRNCQNIILMPNYNMEEMSKIRQYGQKTSRKFRKIGVNTLMLYFDESTSLEEQLETAVAQMDKGQFPKIFVECLSDKDKKIVEDFKNKRTDLSEEIKKSILIGRDSLPDGADMQDAKPDVVRVVAVANAILNDNRLRVDFGLTPEDLYEQRKRMLSAFKGSEIISENFDEKDANALENIMQRLYIGDIPLKITPINWQEVRDYYDSMEQVLRSL